MGKKSSPPQAPDFSALSATSLEQSKVQAQISADQLEWAKQQYASDKEITSKVIDSALKRQDLAQGYAQDDRNRYEAVYQPLEDKQARDAQTYDSPERIAVAQGQAQSTVNQNMEAQRQAALQNLTSFGVDPSSTRYAALDASVRTQGAAAAAGAANTARDATVNRGQQLTAQAVGTGQGYAGQIAGNLAMAGQAGNTGANTTLAQTGSGGATMGTGSQWAAQSGDSIRNAGNILGSQYDTQMKGYEAQQNASSGIGSAIGMGAALFLEEGGAIPDQAIPTGATPGGAVPHTASPSGGKAIDDVDAKLTVGEFVIPKDVMSWKGEEYFQRLIEQTRKAKPQATAKPDYAAVPVGPAQFTSRPQTALPVG